MRALLVATSLLSLAAEPASAEVARVSGKYLQIGVDTASGALVELIDLASKRNLAGTATHRGGLWEVDLEGIGPLTPKDAHASATEPLKGKRKGLRLRWSKFDLVEVPELCVEVTVTLRTNRALSDWSIEIHNRAHPGNVGNPSGLSTVARRNGWPRLPTVLQA